MLSQAGLAVPEPQKNIRGELVKHIFENILWALALATFASGKSGDRFRRKWCEYWKHCQASKVHPWQDLLWDRSSALSSNLHCYSFLISPKLHCLKASSKPTIIIKPSGTWTTDHFVQCGEFIARMDNSLKCFTHTAYDSRLSEGFLIQALSLSLCFFF